MQMAIDKAKKHGIGCVVAKNSTHYGIAGASPAPPLPRCGWDGMRIMRMC